MEGSKKYYEPETNIYMKHFGDIFGLPSPRMPVTNEGLGWDSLVKMGNNAGADWNPGWGGRSKTYLR